MHTNFDELARGRMAEHEAYAERRQLQRIAREARSQRERPAPWRGAFDARWLLQPRHAVLEVAVVAAVAAIAYLG